MTPGSLTDKGWWAGAERKTPPCRDEVLRETRYLTMRDGVRLAADIFRPVGAGADERVPTVVSFTPYVREVEYRVPGMGRLLRLLGKAEMRWGAEFAKRGHAFLHVEIRGAGASFGRKTSIFSGVVAEDGGEVLDWIVAQPWSNGNVGATGISALGLTAMMLAAGKHPALKAIAPRFTSFDIFGSVHPGGLLQNRFVADIGAKLRAMDSNRMHNTAESALGRLVMRALVKGIRGVDEDRDGALLAAAVAEHRDNEPFDRDIAAVRFRDDVLPHSSIPATLETQSPFRLLADIEASGVAVYAFAGWYDAAFQRDMIHLFHNSTSPDRRLVIGPWAHGGRYYSSPLVADDKRRAEFDQAGELVRFFDLHLRGVDREFASEDAVQYFTMAEERWKSAPSWPPPAVRTTTMHLSAAGTLSPEAVQGDGTIDYRVDRTATTGEWSRHGKHLSGGFGPARYPDRAAADRKLLCFTSAPLTDDLEVTGHPLVTLSLSCDREDAALLVYLEDVAPDGRVLPITEADLRLSQRKEDNDPPYRHLGVWRTGAAADVSPVAPGEVMELRLDLLPTSWLFRRGHAIRVAIAGADKDNFVMVPDSGPAPTFTVHCGEAHPSRLDLPVMPRA